MFNVTGTNSSPTWPILMNSSVWTNMTSSMSRPPESTSASLTRISTDSPSLPSSTLPPSTSTSSLTSTLATQTAALISSSIPYTIPGSVTPQENNISSDGPEVERARYLDMLQEQTTRQLLPAILFLAIVAVVGVFGNTLVLLVYSKKVPWKATDIFIMAIAAFDLSTNTLALPVEIYNLIHFWNFDKPVLCKFRVYTNAFTSWTPSVILAAMAFCRYKKICRPHDKQTGVKAAWIATAIISLASCLFAVPHFIFYGIHTVETPKPGVFGKQCSIADKYVGSTLPMVYNGTVMLLFLTLCFPLIIFYVLIGIKVWRHRKTHGIAIMSRTQTKSVTPDSAEEDDKKSQICGFFRKKQKTDIPPEDLNDGEDNDIKSNLTTTQGRKKAKMTTDEEERYCTIMMRSPAEDSSHVNMPLARMLPDKRNKTRDSEMNTDENEDEGDGKLKDEASCEISVALECSNGLQKQQVSKDNAENRQDENSTTSQATRIQKVDINFCLNEGKKTAYLDGVNDHGLSDEPEWPNARVSLQSCALQEMADTLTTAEETKKENTAVKEIEDDSSNTAAKSAAPGGQVNNQSTVPFHDTIVEANIGSNRKKEVTSCDTSSRNSPKNGILTKVRKSQTNSNPPVLSRTTLMLIIITAVYITALVPHMTLISFKIMVPNFMESMDDAAYSTYHLVMRTFFVNSAANAIIYSLCDVRFRKEVQEIMAKLSHRVVNVLRLVFCGTSR